MSTGPGPDRRPAQEAPIRSEDLATEMATVALDKKATELAILDMRGLVAYTDLFVICTASNRRQVQAIADEIVAVAKHEHDITPAVEGKEAARWVLVDLGDIVVHIFDGPLRGFYDLDGLWQDAPRLEVPEAPVDTDEDEEDEEEPVFTLP